MTGVGPGRNPSQSCFISSIVRAWWILPNLEFGYFARFFHFVVNSFPLMLITTYYELTISIGGKRFC